MTAPAPRPGPLRALVILGSSSVITIVAGMLSAKVAAVLIGSDGVGLMALVLTTVSLTNTIMTFGVGQTLVRRVGLDESADPAGSHGGWVHAARTIVGRTALIAVLASIALSPVLTEPLFGAGAPRWWLPGVACAAAAYCWSQLQLSTLVAHHLVSTTARVAVAVAFVSPVINAVAFMLYGVDGVVPGAIAVNAVIFVIVSLFVRRSVVLGPVEPDRTERATRRRRLVVEGFPLVPVALLGGVATLTVLLLVDRYLSREEVGFFRAASTISLAYIAFLATSITQDFFPRLSRIADDDARFAAACDEQVRLILYLAAPIVVAINAALPIIVPILYSREFGPTVDVLEWQVIGDLARLASSVLATAVLVRAGSTARLVPEIVGAAAIIAGSMIGLRTLGFWGLGVGYVAAYAIYATVLILLLTRHRYIPSTAMLVHLVVAMACVATVPVAVAVTGSQAGRLVGVPIAAVLAVHTWRTIGPEAVLAKLRGRRRAAGTEDPGTEDPVAD